MFSPLRTYNGGVEGGGSHFQVLLRYSRWLALPLPRYASRGTRGMPLSSARTFPGIFLTAAPSQPDLWVNACITNLLGGEALERWKQDKFNYFLKVNLNDMGHRNAFDGLVRTWGLGLGILVAGMHRYVGLSCRHTDSPTINPSLVNRVGCAHITNLHMQLHNRPPLNHFLGFTAPNPSSCLLHVQNAALIDWGWGWGIQKLILNFCRLLPPSLPRCIQRGFCYKLRGQLLRPNSDTRLRWWMMKFMEYRDIAGNHGTQRIPRHCQNSPPDHCAPPGEIPN